MTKLWQDYVEPGDELEAGSPMKRSSRNLENEEEPVLPLPENVLTRNLGLHVIVVVTKVIVYKFKLISSINVLIYFTLQNLH